MGRLLLLQLAARLRLKLALAALDLAAERARDVGMLLQHAQTHVAPVLGSVWHAWRQAAAQQVELRERVELAARVRWVPCAACRAGDQTPCAPRACDWQPRC